MDSTITDRQRKIYEFIRSVTEAGGIPPTVREVGLHFGIKSTNGVQKHIQALIRSGHLSRDPGKSRGLSVSSGSRQVATIPVLGRVAAGLPVLAPENREGDVTVDMSLFSLRTTQKLFALTVKGESMIDAHILPGDTVLVHEQATARNGDIIVALVDGESTVKRFFLEHDHVRLQPENKTMKPMIIDRGEFRVLGKVVGVLRKL